MSTEREALVAAVNDARYRFLRAMGTINSGLFAVMRYQKQFGYIAFYEEALDESIDAVMKERG